MRTASPSRTTIGNGRWMSVCRERSPIPVGNASRATSPNVIRGESESREVGIGEIRGMRGSEHHGKTPRATGHGAIHPMIDVIGALTALVDKSAALARVGAEAASWLACDGKPGPLGRNTHFCARRSGRAVCRACVCDRGMVKGKPRGKRSRKSGGGGGPRRAGKGTRCRCRVQF